MSTVQQACDRCEAQLRRNAAYCEECGERTHRARRLIGSAVRIELLALVLVIAVIVGFTYIYSR
jgi:predicted amidophosphoribosyltransferase